MLTVDDIRWPSERDAANKLLLGFMLAAIADVGINLEGRAHTKARDIAAAYVDGTSTFDEYTTNASECSRMLWATLDVRDATPQALTTRIALSLVSAQAAIDRVETLEWFMQFLDALGCDEDAVDACFARFFARAP